LSSDSSDKPVARTQPIQLVPDALVGKNVGGYIIEETLGEGGMGLVYRARHPILKRHFAVKVLRPEAAADASVSGNFEREAQTLSSLKHPHIIDIVGFGALDENRQFMVMEFLQGHTLEAELTKKGRMSPARALDLADQILDALSAAHSVDIIHRDLKPSNVLLATVSGGAEVVKLLDFGLAKHQPETMLGANQSVIVAGASMMSGTPEYVAPEQALGKPASKASDLYSFGVMFFEMLTGFQPFLPGEKELDRVRALLTMHLHQPAPLIGTVAPGAHFAPELEALVAELLRKDPATRPPSAAEVRTRLQKVAVAPAVAPAPRRGPAPMIAAAIALVAVGAGGWWWSQRAPDAPLVVEPPRQLPAAPDPVAVKVDPAPAPVPAPAPAPVHVAPKVEPVAPKPEAPKVVTFRTPRVEIRKSGCEPSERWRAAAMAQMQELQQAAAALNSKKAWALFERAEPELTEAISHASTGVECDAVESKISQLARTFKP
jgi:tRNA A-37 threonylcarbamoyl transferase component Bud32